MNEIESEQAEYELKVEHYLSLYQLTKCKDSTDDIQCQIEALKQYLEERIMCDVMCDGKPYDNRKENLRIVTHMQNMKNIKLSVSNTSGYKGMHWCKLEKKWKAFIAVNKRTIHLGTFANKEDAINARKEAEKKYYNKFSRNSEDLLNGTR